MEVRRRLLLHGLRDVADDHDPAGLFEGTGAHQRDRLEARAASSCQGGTQSNPVPGVMAIHPP